MRTSDVSGAVDVSLSEGFVETPSRAPQAPDSTRPGRHRQRRPRPAFIRDVRRQIETSWLAKVGQRWRWTPLDREYLRGLVINRTAWEIMALWDCYLERPWQECHISHFSHVIDRLADAPRYRELVQMYEKRLRSKSARLSRAELARF